MCRGEVVIDPAGSVWVASSTRSDDFPMVDAFDPGLSGPSDAVVFRLSNDLSNLEFSTYFGGESDDARCHQFSSAAALAYVTGGKSNDLPTTPGPTNPTWQGMWTATFSPLTTKVCRSCLRRPTSARMITTSRISFS